MKLKDVILIFLRDLKIKLCKHNKKEIESVHYIKVYANVVSKNGFVYVKTSDANLFYQLRTKPSTYQRDFNLKYTQDITFAYCLISVPLYTMFMALAF